MLYRLFNNQVICIEWIPFWMDLLDQRLPTFSKKDNFYYKKSLYLYMNTKVSIIIIIPFLN